MSKALQNLGKMFRTGTTPTNIESQNIFSSYRNRLPKGVAAHMRGDLDAIRDQINSNLKVEPPNDEEIGTLLIHYHNTLSCHWLELVPTTKSFRLFAQSLTTSTQPQYEDNSALSNFEEKVIWNTESAFPEKKATIEPTIKVRKFIYLINTSNQYNHRL